MILTFLSEKGGVGKSTLAMQIAYELTARGKTVALVDADRQGTCMNAAAVSAAAGLEAPTVMAMGEDLSRPSQVPRLAAQFDHVVIDTPAGAGPISRAAARVAEVAIIPVSPGLSLWALQRAIEVVKDEQNRRPALLGLLLSCCNGPRNAMGQHAREVLAGQELGLPVMAAQTYDRVAWVEATMDGKTVGQHLGGEQASSELDAVIQEIFERGARKGKRSAA